MRTPKLITSLSMIAVLGAALAGCGGSSTNGIASKTPNEIVTAAEKAAEGAKSVRVAGLVTSSGTPLNINLQIATGKGAKGTISEGSLSFQLIRVGESVYIKGSSAFYQHFAGSLAAKLLQGKWLKAPSTGGEFEKLGDLTSMHKLMHAVLGEHGSLSKGGVSTVLGHEVVSVKDVTNGGTLYVATKGKPYPIEVSKTGSNGGTVRFEDWNESVSISAPSNSLDISKLSSGT